MNPTDTNDLLSKIQERMEQAMPSDVEYVRVWFKRKHLQLQAMVIQYLARKTPSSTDVKERLHKRLGNMVKEIAKR